MRRRRHLIAEIRDLREQLDTERWARHEAEVRAAAARGELRGYRSAFDNAARDAAARAQEFTTR